MAYPELMDDLRKIIDIEIGKVMERLKRHQVTLNYDEDVKDFLIELDYKPEFGARPLRRTIERHVEDPLAEQILRRSLAKGATIRLIPGDKKLNFKTETEPSELTAG